MTLSFSEMPRPLIVGSMSRRSEQDAIDYIKASEGDGAKAFTFGIQNLEEKYRNEQSFKRIAASTEYPIMAIYYRNGDNLKLPDCERLDILEKAVKGGFRSVDLPMYLFDENPADSLKTCKLSFADACPKEVSMKPEAVDKQKNTVGRFKALGAEVLVSAHVEVELRLEQAVSLALEMESRGADIVKIVTACDTSEHALEILQTNLELKKELKVPSIYTCSGYHGKLIRRTAPLFGTMLVFSNHEYGELSVAEMPLIRDMVHFYKLTEWRAENNG